MITIEYCKHGKKVSDFEYEEWVEQVLAKNPDEDFAFKVSTATPIDAIRVAIKKGKIDCKKVQFRFEGWDIAVDKHGHLEYWPEKFCECQINLLSELI